MQPKVVCLCLLAMLLFTSTGCALPVNVHQRPKKPAAQHKLKPHQANGLPPKLLTPALSLSSRLCKPHSPYEASFLDFKGRPRPDTEKAEKAHYRLAAVSARERVDWALQAILKPHEDNINQNTALHDLFRAGITWGRDYVPVGIAKAELVVYFAIKGGICEPSRCLGFTVCHPMSSGSTQIRAYGELHYPNGSPGVFGILAFNGGRNCPEKDPAIQGKLDTFLKFLEVEVEQAKAQHVFKTEPEAPGLAHYLNGAAGPARAPVLPTPAPPTVPVNRHIPWTRTEHTLAHHLQLYLNDPDRR
ncbi:hypothetical protein BDP27DRAFT_1366926 [Rhodocollybia butyracea]|uniref:Lipoprotein n=1 Tax=Rhodocollybia butyracea TaxID=206335 RepID=A0A9P5PGC0_9AGAR|nr:hypothetical protein BDP27DRAFT_1366926 [Rhodocollybia butyracea]